MYVTDDDVFTLAKKSARLYCKKFNAFNQLDDAISEACVFILTQRRRGRLEALEEPQIKRRTVLALIRWFQNENGLRRTTKLTRVPLSDEHESNKSSINEYEERETQLNLIRRAASNAQALDCLDVIYSIFTGEAIANVCKSKRLNKKIIAKVFIRFKFELGKLMRADTFEVENNGDTEKCPLFKDVLNKDF